MRHERQSYNHRRNSSSARRAYYLKEQIAALASRPPSRDRETEPSPRPMVPRPILTLKR